MDKNFEYSYLDQLSPTEVFRLLTAAAEKFPEQYSDISNVRIIFSGTAPFIFVALEVPDPYADENKTAMPEAQQGLFKSLVEGFKEMTGRGERYHSPEGESKPLLEGIAWLLLKSANEADEREAGGTDEYLVVSRVIDEREAEVLFKNLSFHATSTRVSAWESSGPAGAGGYRYLFHLKHDSHRKSSFLSLGAGGILEGCCILKGFEVDGLISFLPLDSPPDERKLKYFCRLLDRAPGLFGSGEKINKDSESGGLLAAVLEWPEEQESAEFELEFLYLAGLRFFQQEYFTRRKVSHARFEYMELKESRRSLEGLGEAINNSEPYVGYRLELRPTRYLEKNDLQRLHEQKARLEYNLAYLETLMKPHPVLMRFTQKQLPALAAELRSFPLQVIYEGSIKYGFQATGSEPAGYHFILIDPAEASKLELDPLLLFRDLDVPHIRFHLDPFWARHYFEVKDVGTRGRGALVFVPEGCALFPSIHSWNRGNMEYFLRETMEEWFRERLKGTTIPDRPLYIFDGEPRPKAPIYVSVLNQERMEPLHTRLGWINDNLIINHVIEKEGLIEEMARDITWSELARKIKTRSGEIRQDFMETALDAGKQMAQTTNEMTRVLTAEIERTVKETFRMMQRIRKMDERLREWDEVMEDMENVLQEIRKKRQSVSYQKGLAKNEFWRMEQEVEKEIKHSEKRRQELQEKIDEEIKKMRETSKNLKARLRTLRL